jgi:hypothetical protein
VGSPRSFDSRRISSFVRPGVGQRGADVVLLRGAGARPVVAPVVRDLAVDDVLQSFLLGQRRELREELVLAEEAPLRGVLAVAELLQLAGLDEDLSRADLAGEPLGILEFGPGVRLAERGHGDGAVPEDVVGDLQEERAVHAAGVGDQDAAHLGQGLPEGFELLHGQGFFGTRSISSTR